MATSSAISKLTATEQAQFFYVTYYGRPADPAGLTYWAGVIAKDGLDSVAKNFSNSAEAKVKYPSLGSSSNLTQLKSDIQTLYKTVFGRDPLATDPATGKPYDAGGLDYWYDGVVKGTFSFGQLSIILYNAAAENPVTQQDVLAIGNRATAAQSFTDSLKTPAQIAAYSGQTAVTSTSTWLATVDYRTETVTNAVATKSDLIFNLVINPDKPNTANPVITVAALAVNEDSKDNVGKVTATDADGDKLLYSVDAASAKGGVVSIDAAGSFKYSPAGDFAGSDSFKVTVSDGRGGVSVATVNVTVAEVNAVKATASLAATEDSVASGKIAFDNPGAETLIASVKTPATNGKVAFVSGSADGSFTYTPNENYNGSDVFVIEVKDGTKVSTQTVTVTVASVNDTPVIATAAETISVTEDVAFTTGKVGASDADLKDASPDVITYSAAGAAKGTVSFTAAGDYTYTPKANENGSDSFVITATDKAGAKATKTVAVNIAAVNDAPVAASTASISTNEDVSVKGSMSASDADANDTLAYAVKTQGTKGSVALAADGSYTYTPNKDANGTDSFVLTASDGTATVSQTVSVSIAAVNDAPVLAATATATVAEDSTLSATVSATDPDTGDVLSYAIKTAPTNGLATISAAGVVSYAPKLNYSGADSLEVEVTDAAGAKSRQVLSITVSPVNDAPVAASGTASVVGGAAVTIPLADLISDVETAKDKLQIVDVIASRGNVSVSGTNLVYTAQAGGANTTDTVYFTVQDEGGAKSSAASISVSIVTRTGGTSGNDVLGGSSAAEEIAGLAGDDFINGGGGYDLITAGTGNDTVVFSTQAAQILGGAGTDTLKLPTVGDLRFDLTSTTNQYVGLTKNASPASGGETVTVLGFENIDASAAQVSVTIKGSADGSVLIGGDLGDSVIGGAGNDSLEGGLDNDTLVGGGGVDTVRGGDGNDTIIAAGMLFGDKGADTITLNGAGTVYGGDGADSLIHNVADSVAQLWGEDGNDTIISTATRTVTIDGGSGNDNISASGTGDSVAIYGQSGADTIAANGLYDYISGGDDNDIITLSADADTTTTVVGGAGVDTVVFSSMLGINRDVLKNFSGVEVLSITATGAATVTLNGDSMPGLVDLNRVILNASDSVTIQKLTQNIEVVLQGSNDNTRITADSTTGTIIVIADSIGADDTVSAYGANDYFRDTVGSGASYVFTNAGDLEFVELTGAKANVTAAVSLVSGQSLTLTSVTGDSVKLDVALVNGGTGSADTVTITGGSLGDTVNLAGAERATVYGGSGNDSIDASNAGTVSLYGDDGNDTIIVGAFDSVFAGSGEDLIILSAGNSATHGAAADSTTYIDGGPGNDAVRVSGSGGSITSTLVSVEYLDLTSATANGLDVAVTLQGSSFGQVSVDGDTLAVTNTVAGAGAATIVLSNGTGSGDTAVRITADSLSDVVIVANTGIDSSDIISIAAGVADTDVITGSLARSSSSVSYNLTSVTGIDSLTISRASGATTIASATASVTTGADSISVTLNSSTADSIALNLSSGSGSVTVVSGEMADVIDVRSALRGSTITTNGGADSVNAQQSADTMSDYLDLGSGNDTALISGRDTVLGGAGNDSIVGVSGADSLVIDAESGNDTISINGANDSVLAGDGNDFIILTGTTLATATITGGGGNDTVRLTGAVSSAADSIFTNISAEVLDLASDTVAQSLALGSIAAANGFETIRIGAGDSVSMTAQDTISVVLGAGSSSAMRVTADSLTAVTFRADSVADAFGSEDTISLSSVNTGDVLVISGSASATYNLTNVTGLDSISASTTAGTTRTLTITGLGSDSVTNTSITAADTSTTLDITIASANAATFTMIGNIGADKVSVASGGSLSVDLGRGADSVFGGLGSDVIRVNSSVAGDTADANYVSGGGGNDIITGGVGNDIIVVGADVAASISGASLVTAGSGNDSVVVLGVHGADTVYLGAGNDSLLAGADTAGVYVDLGAGADSVSTSGGNDIIVISSADLGDTKGDIVLSGSGKDSIVLGAGSDTIDAGAGNDTVVSGSGNDSIVAGTGDDSIDAGAGNDTVNLSGGGNNRVFTGDGADSVFGGSGADYIDLSALDSAVGDSNFANGGDSTDTLIGGSMNDTLIGGSGADSIVAGGGADYVNAGPGADFVSLGDGDDTFVVDQSGDFYSDDSVTELRSYDTVRGGSGDNDTLLLKGTGALTLSFASLQYVSDIERFAFEGSDSTSSVTVSNDLFDRTLSLSFVGSNSVTVNDTNVTETGSVYIDLGSSVARASIEAVQNLAESVSALAGDSLDSGRLIFKGQASDELYLREFTVASGNFDMDSVSAGKITLGADTGGYFIDLNNSFNGVDVVVAITGADSLADSTAVYWNSYDADSVGVTITTRSSADSIVTGGDNDVISSGKGDDTISAGYGLDSIDAGSGNDYVLIGSAGVNGAGADTKGVDLISLGAGNDTLMLDSSSTARSGASVTLGGGADSVNLGADTGAADVVVLLATDTLGDWVNVGGGNDFVDLSLSSGKDTVITGSGLDTVYVGDGDDSVALAGDSSGVDYVYLGGGNDTVSDVAADTSPAYVDLGTGADQVLFHVDGRGADTIVNATGDSQGDYIVSGSGADVIDLSRGTGADTIEAGAGNDTIYAGSGTDTVRPGPGADYIDLGADTVADRVIIPDTVIGGSTESNLSNLDVIANVVKGTDKVAFVQEITAPASTLTYTAVSAAVGGEGSMFSATGVYQKTLAATSLIAAVQEIEYVSTLEELNSSGSGIGAGKVFTFELAGSTYIAVGKATSSIGTLVQISGVTAVTNVADVVDLSSAGQNIVGASNQMVLSLGAGNDTVTASSSTDYLQMGSGADRVIFAAGRLTSADTLVGGAGVDTISFSGADTLGDAAFTNVTTFETLVLANGSNQLAISTEFVESGIRAIYGGSGGDSISLAADTLTSLGSGLTLSLGSGVDTIVLTSAATVADSKFGGFRDVEVLDLAETSSFITLADSAQAGGLRIVFDGIQGDTIDISTYSAAVTVVSSDGNDWIRLGSGNDSISIPEDKLSTDDTLVGGGGVDTLGFSSAGAIVNADFSKVTSFEAIVLANGTNTLTLAGSADTMGLASVFGGTGADAIDLGGVGSARGLYVVPGAGDDSVVLGLGNDTVIPGGGADTAVGGSGTDVILLAQGAAETTYSSLVSYNPFSVSGTPATMLVIDLSNVASAQTVSSGATLRFADTSFEVVDATGQLNSNVDLALVGNGAANTLIGGAGDDYIRSMTTANNDDANGNVLAGGNGADYLRSGSGSDTLYGGSVSGLALSVDSIGTGDNVFFSHLFSSSVADSLRSGATFDYANIYEGRGGNDVMIASSGKDIFFYQGTASQGSDTIYNFKVGEDYLFLVSQSSFPNGTDVVFFGDTVGANRDVGTAQTAFLASDSVTGTFAVDGVNVTVSTPTVAWSYEAVVGQVGMYTVKFDPDGSGANPGFTITLVGVDGTITSINSLFPPGG